MNVFFAARDVMPEIDRHGLLSINRSPLAMGVLTGTFHAASELPAGDIRRNTFAWLDYFKEGRVVPSYLGQLEAVRELLRTGGRSVAQGALGWLWAKHPRTVPIPGFRTRAHADDCIAALSFGPLPQSVFDEIEQRIERNPRARRASARSGRFVCVAVRELIDAPSKSDRAPGRRRDAGNIIAERRPLTRF